MTRALVTGATGFIGPHLVRALADEGVDVTCLRRAGSDVTRLKPLGVRLCTGDADDPQTLPAAVQSMDVVYHLAGATRALSYRQFLAANAEGTRNVLIACASQPNPPVMVLVSSLAAAGPALNGQPRCEDAAPLPVSHYGRSKRAAEIVGHEFADRVPVTIVRPPLVFGEGDRSVLAIFRPIRRWGVHLVPGFVDRRLSLIHAADLASALIAAARDGRRLPSMPPPGEASGFSLQTSGSGINAHGSLTPETRSLFDSGYYHVACDEHPTYAELGCRISLALGHGAVVLRTPEWLTWLSGGLSEIAARIRRRPHVFNWDKAREAVAGSWTCSPSRAKRELGWSCAADLDTRLRETVAWYRLHRWL